MTVTPIIGHDEAVAAWVAANLFPGRGFGNCKAIGWAVGDDLIAGTVLHNFEPDAGVIEITTFAGSPRWLTRDTLRFLFGYVFDRCACQMVVMRVSERNRRMVSIARRFRFSEHRIERLRGRDEAEMVFTLTDDQWAAARLEFGLDRA